uniref:Uncharacterized protein n=1 Tax=Magallana gigas TaxID=29159 RepID=K1QYR6_MAGGI|eukprot:XP_011418589.1 PREDICTED: uncharacterized protein LOC105321828 [Crassostrea gigas]
MFLHWIFVCLHIEGIFGHGKLWEPPSRSSMWRRGFHTPMNANDNELNCGGYENQWIHNRGRCGVCGDPVQDIPRPNEAGGRYASGVITRNYKTGDVIDLTADLSANHLGYFEYRVCPVEDPNVPVTQDCLDKHPVYITETRDGRYHVKASENGVIFMKGRLPANMSCDHCVLQWRYNTGNRWNCDINDNCGHGMGPQEEFYGCADISIRESPDSTSGSRESPLKPFEPLEIQFQQTLQNFRSISMDEVPYSEDQKTYSTDNYQTSIVTSAYPEVITRSSVTENSVSASRNLSESTEILPSLLAAKETKYQTPSSFIKPVTLKLESDPAIARSRTPPTVIQPVTVKSAMKSLLNAEQTLKLKSQPTLKIDALDIKTTQHNGQKVAVLEKLSDMLWSMMKSLLVESNKRNGQNMASVKWDPLRSLGKSPVPNTDVKNRYKFELKSPWPPTRPMIVQADYGIDDIIEGNPIVLSEISPKEYLKGPMSKFRSAFNGRMSEFDKYRHHTHNLDSRLFELKQKRDKMTTTEEMATLKTLVCSGASSFLYVKGINTWCTRNCKAGNCPQHMCRCVNKRVKVTTSSMLDIETTTSKPIDPTKPPILPILSEFNRDELKVEKVSKPPTNVNFLSKEAYIDLYKKNPKIFGQKIKYNTPQNKNLGQKIKDNVSQNKNFEQKIKYDGPQNKVLPRDTMIKSPSLKKSSVQKPSAKGSPKKSIICHGADQYGQQSAIKGWCTENCRKGFCPKRVCVCKYG